MEINLKIVYRKLPLLDLLQIYIFYGDYLQFFSCIAHTKTKRCLRIIKVKPYLIDFHSDLSYLSQFISIF
jgi:hypothetical protein